MQADVSVPAEADVRSTGVSVIEWPKLRRAHAQARLVGRSVAMRPAGCNCGQLVADMCVLRKRARDGYLLCPPCAARPYQAGDGRDDTMLRASEHRSPAKV